MPSFDPSRTVTIKFVYQKSSENDAPLHCFIATMADNNHEI